MTQKKETKPFFDFQGIKNEMDKWIFPLHFIDFETTKVAFPFNKGRKPYEGIAFQFSHHVVHKDGTDRTRWPIFKYKARLFSQL